MKKGILISLFFFCVSVCAITLHTKEVKAWNSGTNYGFSTNFNYQITSNYNVTFAGGTTPVTTDEAQEAGGGYRKLSDGNLWISKGWTGSFKVTDGLYNNYPITSVVAANSGIVQVTRKTTGTLAQAYNEYNVKGLEYGTTTIRVTRKNGDYFDVPVNVSQGVTLYNDEGLRAKKVILGWGQTIQPSIKTSTTNLFGNKPLYYQWISDNTDVVTVINGNQLYAKGKGIANVYCKLYDTLRCYNKWHYGDVDSQETLKITYRVEVKEDTPIIQLKDDNGELLNQKVKVKKVGEQIVLRPSLEGLGSVMWQFESSDKKIAEVDGMGYVTAVGVGTATISAKGGEQTQYFKINVISSPSSDKVTDINSVSLKIPNNSIELGSKLDLQSYYVTNPLNTKLYSFDATSSDESVISIDGISTLLAKKLGKSKITIRVSDFRHKMVTAFADVLVRLKAPSIKVKRYKKKNIIIYNTIPQAKKYTIYRSKKKTKGYKVVGTTTKTSFTDKIKKTTGYYYKVVASNGTALYNSADSNIITTCVDIPKIKKIKKIDSLYAITLKAKKYDGFQLYYGTNKKCKKLVGTSKTKKFVVNCKLKKHKNYYFKVRGIKKIKGKTIKGEFSKVYKYKRK